MSILDKLASAFNREDELPNQLLAQDIAAKQDTAAVQELVDHLAHRDKAIRHDCIKVLYEIGALQPALIADHVAAFVALLTNRDNRLVWGGMTALGAIAASTVVNIIPHAALIMQATEQGSVITQDWGVRVLALVAAADGDAAAEISPFLLRFLANCPAKDVPRHAASVVVATNAANRQQLIDVLEARQSELSPAQLKRLQPIIRQLAQQGK
jgi:hypothetical protein